MCSRVIRPALVRAHYHTVMLLAGMPSAVVDRGWAVALLWNSNGFKDRYVISTPSDVYSVYSVYSVFYVLSLQASSCLNTFHSGVFKVVPYWIQIPFWPSVEKLVLWLKPVVCLHAGISITVMCSEAPRWGRERPLCSSVGDVNTFQRVIFTRRIFNLWCWYIFENTTLQMCITETPSQDKKSIQVGSLLLTTILAEIIWCSILLQTANTLSSLTRNSFVTASSRCRELPCSHTVVFLVFLFKFLKVN